MLDSKCGVEGCLTRVLIVAVKYRDQKVNCGGKGLFNLNCQFIVHHWRKSGQELKEGRNQKTGAEAVVTEGAVFWLALCGLITQLSYRNQPKNGTTYYGLGLPRINH